MSEHKSDNPQDPTLKGPGEGDPDDHHKGGLGQAPAEPTTDESGTGSADKRSPTSLAEEEATPERTGSTESGGAGGDITR
jgi:hypothetical protein